MFRLETCRMFAKRDANKWIISMSGLFHCASCLANKCISQHLKKQGGPDVAFLSGRTTMHKRKPTIYVCLVMKVIEMFINKPQINTWFYGLLSNAG